MSEYKEPYIAKNTLYIKRKKKQIFRFPYIRSRTILIMKKEQFLLFSWNGASRTNSQSTAPTLLFQRYHHHLQANMNTFSL